jgi:battenin
VPSYRRHIVANWTSGLINNVLYVVVLSAALDLVGPNIPKGVVLLFDVVPSFFTKLVAPYFIHLISYWVRIYILVALSAGGMLLIATTPDDNIPLKMVGVMLASFSSGLGELSFLGLTHFYGHFSLAFWGSGTGAAGLVGAGAYVVATTALGLSVKTTLLTSSCLPLILILSFFVVLPKGPLSQSESIRGAYETLSTSEAMDPVVAAQQEEDFFPASTRMTSSSSTLVTDPSALSRFRLNLLRAKDLFFPYMLPLLLVYVAEYTVNQGVAPTLLFPLKSSPFKEFREFYPTYNAIYQVGVFISRSSTPFIRIHNLYAPSMLQVLNLAILSLHAMFDFLPNVWFVFAIIFWEGLLGGLVYVNTFAEITDNVPSEEREFSLSATSVSDSGGICIAGFLGMMFEKFLCRYQVNHGRDYCKRT